MNNNLGNSTNKARYNDNIVRLSVFLYTEYVCVEVVILVSFIILLFSAVPSLLMIICYFQPVTTSVSIGCAQSPGGLPRISNYSDIWFDHRF